MVTDLEDATFLGCVLDGVENIIVADDISRKASKHTAQPFGIEGPRLSSVLLTADKHFFRHVETVKRQTGISLNLGALTLLR